MKVMKSQGKDEIAREVAICMFLKRLAKQSWSLQGQDERKVGFFLGFWLKGDSKMVDIFSWQHCEEPSHTELLLGVCWRRLAQHHYLAVLKTWLNSTLIMRPGPMLGNTQRHTHTRTRGGRADICYMRAMINRLIRNGLIKFTLHIQTCLHTWRRSLIARTCPAACVRPDLQPSAGAASMWPAVIRAISLSDGWAAERLAHTPLFISVPEELRWQKLRLPAKAASNSSMSE